MESEQKIVQDVYAAKEDEEAEERLIRKYLPFIMAETSKNIHKTAGEQDDEVSIAMFAFHEAVKGYQKEKGAFLSYASMRIKARLIDFHRKEIRNDKHLSFDAIEGDESGVFCTSEADAYELSFTAREEIREFCAALARYNLTLNDIAENCPRQERTRKGCYSALNYARKETSVMDTFLRSGRIPLKQMAEGAKVERKTLERHRKYMAALLLAFTNGFEIIRSHLRQMMPEERREEP